jgi:hypothetical protein
MVNSGHRKQGGKGALSRVALGERRRSDLLGRLSGYNQSVGKATATGLCQGASATRASRCCFTYIILENFVVSHNPAYGLNPG